MSLENFVSINRQTGKKISGPAHLTQSVADIITTRKQTRVERRSYGSDLPDHIDLSLIHI